MRNFFSFIFLGLVAVPPAVFAVGKAGVDLSASSALDRAKIESDPVTVTAEDFEAFDQADASGRDEQEDWSDGHKNEAIRGDWNQDGFTDVVTFTDPTNEYFATLTIYEGRPDGGLVRVAQLAEAFSNKGDGGVKNRSETTFEVHEVVMGGRSTWGQETVIAYRNGAYLIAGVDRWGYDGMERESDTRCERHVRPPTGRRCCFGLRTPPSLFAQDSSV